MLTEARVSLPAGLDRYVIAVPPAKASHVAVRLPNAMKGD